MQFSQSQTDHVARNSMLERLERGFRASVPDADRLESPVLRGFFAECEHDARALGLGNYSGPPTAERPCPPPEPIHSLT